MSTDKNIKTAQAKPDGYTLLCAGDAERFEKLFGCTPDKFTGINAPYEFLGCQEAEELLQKFGFCSMCLGSGTAWAECCDGYRCSCNGQAQPFTCQCCDGTGEYNTKDGNPNFDYLMSMANSNKGRLASNDW